MKKGFTFLSIVAIATMLAPTAAAQENAETTEFPPVEDIYTHSWRDNWYIQLGAGAQMPLFEKDAQKSNFDIDKTTAVYEAGVGHWFSPYFGFRFRGQGGALHYENASLWKKMKYANLNLEITWDMFNSLGGVNDKRVFSIIPYLGVGGTYAWDYNTPGNIKDNDGSVMDHQGVLNASLGFEFRFRCHKNVDLYLDARATAMADNINNLAWKTGVDPVMSLTAGLSINLGKEGRHVTKYTPYDCSGKIRELNDRINELRGNLSETEAQLRAAQAQLPCPEVTEAPEPQVVQTPSVIPAIRFRLNSARVSENDKITLYDVAQMMKENEDVKVVVKGYADKNTGTEAYNEKLSERRAAAVKKILTDYGVEENRIETEAIGVSSQPYSDNNNWNRVVLISIK